MTDQPAPDDHEAWHDKLADEVDRLFTREQELFGLLDDMSKQGAGWGEFLDWLGFMNPALLERIDAALEPEKPE